MLYLNLAPNIYYGLKPLVNKGRFAILILTVGVIRFRVKIPPASLYSQGFLRLMTIFGEKFRLLLIIQK